MGDGERSMDELLRRVRRCDAQARRRIEESKQILLATAASRRHLRLVLEQSAAFCEQARAYVGEARAALRESRDDDGDDDRPPRR